MLAHPGQKGWLLAHPGQKGWLRNARPPGTERLVTLFGTNDETFKFLETLSVTNLLLLLPRQKLADY